MEREFVFKFQIRLRHQLLRSSLEKSESILVMMSCCVKRVWVLISFVFYFDDFIFCEIYPATIF